MDVVYRGWLFEVCPQQQPAARSSFAVRYNNTVTDTERSLLHILRPQFIWKLGGSGQSEALGQTQAPPPPPGVARRPYLRSARASLAARGREKQEPNAAGGLLGDRRKGSQGSG